MSVEPPLNMAGISFHVRFSNRPFGVKHFQTIQHCSIDVAQGWLPANSSE